ncbi:MAG: autotransporter-associated beta strand repeat-containing protein, partial [Patescibacteria group bacterium]|nr:autotransporter-associated beta strand repeat-containing protein [Patescibacteria group bacterium]
MRCLLRNGARCLMSFVAVFTVGAPLLPSQWSRAATVTWDADTGVAGAQDGSGNWDTATANWINAGANGIWTAGDDAVFGVGGAGAATVTLTEAISAGALTFNAGATYTVAGSTLTRTGSITVNAAEARIDSVIAGAGSHKHGSGRLILTGENTMTGSAFDIRGGVVNLQNSKALGTYDYCHVYETTAALEVQGGITVTNGLYIKGAGADALGSLRSVSGNNTWAGFVRQHSGQPNASIGVDSGSTLTITGVIQPHDTSSGTLTKVGGGLLVLTNNNTYAGATVVAAGVVNVRHNNALGTTVGGTTVNSGAALEVQGGITVAESLTISGSGIGSAGVLRNVSGNNVWNGNIVQDAARIGVDAGMLTINGQISGAGTLQKTGAGTLVLTGNNTYSATTDVVQGTLNIRHNNALGASSYCHVMDEATLALQGGISVARDLYVGNASAASTTVSLRNVSGDNTWSGWVRLHEDHSHAIVGVDGGTLTIAGVIEPHEGSTGSLTKVGTGTLILTNANTYTGPTTIAVGVVNVRNNNALGATVAGTTVDSGAALQVQGSVTVAESLSISGGGIGSSGALRSMSGDNVWNGNIVESTARIGVDSGTLTINGVISGSGTFVKTGLGKLVLTSNNTYSATTDVAQGVLNIRHGNALGTSSYCHVYSEATLEMQGGISVARGLYVGNVDPASSTPSLRSMSGDNTWSGSVYLHVNHPHAIVDVDAGSLTISGAIEPHSGSVGSLTKTGTGLLRLTNANNTYTGPTTVSAGTLLVNGALNGGGTVTVNAGATLGGSGRIAGLVGGEGLVSPGASAGILSVATI